MTIAAIAQRAEVSAQSVYAIFKSKTGILSELLDQSTFGADYEDAVRRALSASDPETRLRRAAPIARQIHDAQSATFDLLRGAGVVAPELARLAQQILAWAPGAIRLQKELIVRWRNADLSSAIRFGINAFAQSYATGEPREATLAFLEKRRPKFE